MAEDWEILTASSDPNIIDKMRRRGKCTSYGSRTSPLCLDDADFEWILVNGNLGIPIGATTFGCMYHHNIWLATSTASNWNIIPLVHPPATNTCTCPMSQLLRSGCKCGGK